MRVFVAIIALGLADPVLAQQTAEPEDEAIVVKGLRNGSKVVELDFNKVWRRCVECKRALAKLDLLAESYREEKELAALMAGGAHSGGVAASSSIGTWQRSSANLGPTTVAGLAAARRAESSRILYEHLYNKHVAPERGKMMNYMQSFLDQLTTHVAAATEEERKEHGARASIIGKRNTKVNAKRLVRIDVTDAVITRLDAKDFTISLPAPPASTGAARK